MSLSFNPNVLGCVYRYLENGVRIDVVVARVSAPVLNVLAAVVHTPLLLIRQDGVRLPNLRSTETNLENFHARSLSVGPPTVPGRTPNLGPTFL